MVEHVAQSTKRSNSVQGVLYIGKADDLQDRYWKFVQSWKSGVQPDHHGCRSNKYDLDVTLQKTYPIDNLRVRCMPIVEHLDNGSTVQELRKVLIPGDVRKKTTNEELIADSGLSSNPRNDYSSYYEGKIIRLFKGAFGHIPELNMNSGERESPAPDDAFFDKQFGSVWQK